MTFFSFFFFFFPLPTVDVERKKREKRWETSRWDEVGRVVKRLLLAVSLRAGRRPVCLSSALRLKMKDERKRRKKGENEEGNIKIALVGGGGVRPLQRR